MMRRSSGEGYQRIWAGAPLTWDFRTMMYGGRRALSRLLWQFISMLWDVLWFVNGC